MSNRALTWAFAQSTGNPARKAVLVALADMADEADSCWPSQATLARMTDQSERSVRGHLGALEEAGFVRRSRRRDAGGHRSSDRYVLAVAVAVGVANRQDPPVAKSAARTAPLPADSVAPTGKSRQVTLKTPKETPTVSPAARASNGTRLPDDWLRSPGDRAWQAEHGIPDEFAREATAEFKDHFRAATGRSATKRDWSAAWRNWQRRAWRERHGEAWRRKNGQPVRVVDFDAERQKAKLERDRARFASTDQLAGIR